MPVFPIQAGPGGELLGFGWELPCRGASLAEVAERVTNEFDPSFVCGWLLCSRYDVMPGLWTHSRGREASVLTEALS